MSFRTERSVVKNLENIHLYASEILRFALNDNKGCKKRGCLSGNLPFYLSYNITASGTLQAKYTSRVLPYHVAYPASTSASYLLRGELPYPSMGQHHVLPERLR